MEASEETAHEFAKARGQFSVDIQDKAYRQCPSTGSAAPACFGPSVLKVNHQIEQRFRNKSARVRRCHQRRVAFSRNRQADLSKQSGASAARLGKNQYLVYRVEWIDFLLIVALDLLNHVVDGIESRVLLSLSGRSQATDFAPGIGDSRTDRCPGGIAREELIEVFLRYPFRLADVPAREQFPAVAQRFDSCSVIFDASGIF